MNRLFHFHSLAVLPLLWPSALAANLEESRPPDRTLTVVVHDYVGLSNATTRDMEMFTGQLMSRAGIRIVWVQCTGLLVSALPDV